MLLYLFIDKAFNKIVKWTNTIDFDEFMDLIEDCHLLVLSESRHMYGSGCLTRDDCRTIFVNVQLHQQHDGSEDSRIESNVLQRKRSILSKLTKRAQRQSKV